MWENVSQRGPFDDTALHLCFLRLWAYCGQEASERNRGMFVYVVRRRQMNRSVSILPGLYTVSVKSVSVSHPCTDSPFQSDKHAHTPLSVHTHHGLSPNRSTTVHKHRQVRKPSKSELEETQDYCFSITQPDMEQMLSAPVWVKRLRATDTNQQIPD